MREILFRGLTTKGDFVYGLYVQNAFDGASRNVAHGIQSAGCYPVEINSNTLGQYTGLKDCNGVKIFEGDIVEYKPYHNLGHSEDKLIGVVHWGETGDSDGWCHCKHYEFTVGWGSLADVADSDYPNEAYCKVIGNIHQNPELLERTNANHN